MSPAPTRTAGVGVGVLVGVGAGVLVGVGVGVLVGVRVGVLVAVGVRTAAVTASSSGDGPQLSSSPPLSTIAKTPDPICGLKTIAPSLAMPLSDAKARHSAKSACLASTDAEANRQREARPIA